MAAWRSTWPGSRPFSNKYNARKTEYNGRHFDSMREADVAREIDLRIRAKEVAKVEYQRVFALYGKNGGQVCTHRVDFLLTYPDGHQEVEECKGYPTPEWNLKRKLFVENYPDIPYVVVK